MSSNQTSEHAFQQVAVDMDFSDFDMFTDSTYFDHDSLLSADVALPSIEYTHDLPANFFDSAFEASFHIEGLHTDMSVWPAGYPLGCADDFPAGPVELVSLSPEVTDVLTAPLSSHSSGAIEALWRPLVGLNPAKVAMPDPPTPTLAPFKRRGSKAKTLVSIKATPKPKVTKIKKTAKPAKSHNRTVSAPSGAPRSVQALYKLPWSHLTQEEKGILLLPLLQGIDPTTGRKIGEAGSLLPPPTFEMVANDIFGTGDDGAMFMETPTPLYTSSPAATTTIDLTGDNVDVSDTDAAVFRACQAFNIQHDLEKKKSSLSTVPGFNFGIPDFTFEETNWDVFADFLPAEQGLGGSCCKGALGNSIEEPTTTIENGNVGGASHVPKMAGSGLGQMPTPSGDYGRKRQQEALQRNVMLRAAGRRR
ncbi:hypothetical protein G6011_00971 [Alternaria panax]|uniref:Uncharacterized protein n=1 Tax=Alternaria panax TaxID=48097 RepID=A0AAD4NW56_9PLEO|nr:hypothetical protein G6011_00971 [Alternaria panax]